jgi:hypothetical protein
MTTQMMLQARHQVRGKERGVARHRHDECVGSSLEPGVQAGERAGEAADLVRHQPVAEARVSLEILVAVDQDFADLGREALERPLRHRLAAKRLQSLVEPAHAPSLAAGEHQSGDRHKWNFTSKLRPHDQEPLSRPLHQPWAPPGPSGDAGISDRGDRARS